MSAKSESIPTNNWPLVVAAVLFLLIAGVAIGTAITTRSESAAATTQTTTTTAVTTTAVTTTPATNTAAPGELGRGDLDGNWSTEGATIVDGDGDPVIIRGVNWFGFETSTGAPHGIWSRNANEMIAQIADLGFNTIRLPFSSAMLADGFTPNGINEHENPDLVGLTSLEVMDEIIDMAGANGLAVILDRHTLSPDNRHHLWYDETYDHERYLDDWRLLAGRYADRPNVIGADLYNEPHDDACWGCGDPAVDWHLAAEQGGDAIHEINPNWLIFVEGVEQVDGDSCDGPDAAADCTWWGGNLSIADEMPVELAVPNQVVYSPHEYATSVFRQSWFDAPDFPANMEDIWEGAWGDLERDEVAPVMVGEFGTTLDAEIDAVWLEALLLYLDEIGAGFTFWTFNPNSGDTGGILKDDWVTVDRSKLDFLEPYLLGPFAPTS